MERRCIRYFRGQMPRYLRSPLTGYAAGIPGRAQTCSLRFWRLLFHRLNYGNISCRVQESNLQRPGYEPDALPVELTQRKRMPACNARRTSFITGG